MDEAAEQTSVAKEVHQEVSEVYTYLDGQMLLNAREQHGYETKIRHLEREQVHTVVVVVVAVVVPFCLHTHTTHTTFTYIHTPTPT